MNTANGELSEFKLDLEPFRTKKIPDEAVLHAYALIAKSKSLPLLVSQQVLALHPRLRELRTGNLLTSYGNKYHVQYHHPELGVHVQGDSSLIPISKSGLYKEEPVEVAPLTPEAVAKPAPLQAPAQPTQKANDVRNQLLMQQQLAGNHQMVYNLLNAAESGSKQKLYLRPEQTEYSLDNKKSMAMLLILVER